MGSSRPDFSYLRNAVAGIPGLLIYGAWERNGFEGEVLVTGSSGLYGSEAAEPLTGRGMNCGVTTTCAGFLRPAGERSGIWAGEVCSGSQCGLDICTESIEDFSKNASI